jgi:hypothetical protein
MSKKLAKKRRMNKLKVFLYLMENECFTCGESNPVVLTFHHTKNKSKCISKMYGSEWKKIKEEIDKCVVLCQNCHTLYHAQNTYKQNMLDLISSV